MFDQIMRKFTAFIDPKLEPYRPKSDKKPLKPTPATMNEFIDMLRRTPKTVLSNRDRAKIAAVMSFSDKNVRDLMSPKSNLVFVHEDEYLGPLTLDKLYKSGSTYFPVVDKVEHVEGIIHTESLNNLEVKTLDRAKKYLDKNVYYLHELDSLEFAVEEFARTGAPFFLVLDKTEKLAGSLTVEAIFRFLVG